MATRHRGALFIGFSSMASSACFLTLPMIIYPRVALPTLTWALPHWSRKCPLDLQSCEAYSRLEFSSQRCVKLRHFPPHIPVCPQQPAQGAIPPAFLPSWSDALLQLYLPGPSSDSALPRRPCSDLRFAHPLAGLTPVPWALLR